MNIYRLNQKLRHIMEVFDIIQRDQLQTLNGCYLGIHQDYMIHQVLKFPNLFDINYDELKLNIVNFFQMLKEHNITPIVILSSQIHQKINSKIIMKCQSEKNKAQFRELLYNDAIIDTLLPKRMIIDWLRELQIQFLVVPDAGSQIRYLFTNNFISGILAEISLLEKCFSFKELNYLILNIFDNSFEWIDIKQLTAKSQLSLDSLAELYQLHDYCTRNECIGYNDQILNQFSQTKFTKPFSELARSDQFNVLYNIGQQFFAGKLTLQQRIQKFTNFLIDSTKITQFMQQIKDSPYIDINFDELRLQTASASAIQYPTEILVFQSNGIGLFQKEQSLLQPLEFQEYEFVEPSQLAFEKLNIGYYQGKNQIKLNTSFNLFKETIKNPTLLRSIHFYYKTLKLTSRKSSFELGEQSQQINSDLIQLNLNLRFLHLQGLIDLDNQKGSLYASALSYVKPQYFVPFFIYLKLLESPYKPILFGHFYNPQNEKDDEIITTFADKKDNLITKQLNNLSEHYQEDDEKILLLLRFFMINSISKLSQLDYFGDFITCISKNYGQQYDALLIGLYFELNQRSLIEQFINIGQMNPFYKKYNYNEEFYQFLKKKKSKQEFMTNHNLQHYIDCWTEFLKLYDYIHQKKGMRFDILLKTNEYFQQLIK
ncbi:unnamed protein product [Paramecium pentaurelia]|uniref:Uncharacterized protein n=1 Tax=Paramecium pentaurelia TaxID=43138 RepID=A0A8S1WG85_9CILI|nr:unnamed protein product [Paramecium pentaurelia]